MQESTRVTGLPSKEIKAWKDTSLSNYCLTQCTRTCCNFSPDFALPLRNEDELTAVMGEFPRDLTPHKADDQPYGLKYDQGFCPQYKRETGECGIRDHPHRPLACERFPIEKSGVVVIHSHCMVQESDTVFKDLEDRLGPYGVPVVKQKTPE